MHEVSHAVQQSLLRPGTPRPSPCLEFCSNNLQRLWQPCYSPLGAVCEGTTPKPPHSAFTRTAGPPQDALGARALQGDQPQKESKTGSLPARTVSPVLGPPCPPVQRASHSRELGDVGRRSTEIIYCYHRCWKATPSLLQLVSTCTRGCSSPSRTTGR